MIGACMRIGVALLGACVAVGAHAAGTDSVRIELRADGEVGGTSVRLGDIAFVNAQNLDMVRDLVNVPLGTVVPAGPPVTLDRSVLEAWVLQRAHLRADQIEWRGVERVEVTYAARPGWHSLANETRIAPLDTPLAITRGSPVQLRATAADLEIEGRAQALQDGRVGQQVLVRLAGARGPVPARVIAPGWVEITK